MCDPVSAMAAVNIGTQAVGTYQSTVAANKQADYQSSVARNNAQIAEYEGQYAKRVAAEKAAEHRLNVSKFIGTQRAAMGASGLVADTGSFQDVISDTVESGKLDELSILHEGDKESWKAQVGAQNYRSQVDYYESSKRNPLVAAGTSLLGPVAQFGVNYYSTTKGKKVK